MEEKLKQMKELSQRLRDASKAYYQDGRELMSNLEYDRLYARLEELEKETGITLAQSPTVSVGYEAVDELPKERHEVPMLSLDKTKDVEVLRAFIGKNRTMISWKLDGLTVVLTYRGFTIDPFEIRIGNDCFPAQDQIALISDPQRNIPEYTGIICDHLAYFTVPPG